MKFDYVPPVEKRRNRLTMNYVREYCQKLFDGFVDKAGAPYYKHCEFVGETAYRFALSELGMSKEDANVIRMAGYLHDVVEDTDISVEELAEAFTPQIAGVVKLLTKENGLSHKRYIARLMDDRFATVVKYADSLHNSMIERFPEEERDKHRKKKCLDYLEQSDKLKEKALDDARLYSVV